MPNPKDGSYRIESDWFLAQDAVGWDAAASSYQLEPGDILLKKDYAGESPVVTAQKPLRADRGSKYTSHAMLYVGAEEGVAKVAEASNHHGRVQLSSFKQDYLDKGERGLAYRPRDPNAKLSAAAVAKTFATWPTEIKYSQAHCFKAAFNSANYGKDAEERAKTVHYALKPPKMEMMCSELVVYCHQHYWGKGAPYICLDGLHTSPMRLEDYLNGGFGWGGTTRFDFLGTWRGGSR